MDYLWTPWRYQYIVTTGDAGECVLCAAAASQDDRVSLVVHHGAHNYVLLNRYPYTTGHVMVVPYAHVGTLEDLPAEAAAEMMTLTREASRHLREIYRPEGLNLGMNLGKCAGAGVTGHLHMHVLPRWTGDTSFMTVTAETRIIPEALDTTWEKLRAAFQSSDSTRNPQSF